jgi:hypothetical protein
MKLMFDIIFLFIDLEMMLFNFIFISINYVNNCRDLFVERLERFLKVCFYYFYWFTSWLDLVLTVETMDCTLWAYWDCTGKTKIWELLLWVGFAHGK